MSCGPGHDLCVLLAIRRERCLAAMNKLLANPLFQTNWIVPRNVMCALFWTGVFVVFMGMILLVTSKHKRPALLPWGGVVLGLGLCLLMVCLMLCIHAYCVVANSSRAEDNGYSGTPSISRGQVGVQGEVIRNPSNYNPNLSENFFLPPKFKNRPSAVRFNLVEDPGSFQNLEKDLCQKQCAETAFNIENNLRKSNHISVSVGSWRSSKHGDPSTDLPTDDVKQKSERERSLSDHSLEKTKFDDAPAPKLLDENLPNMSMTRNFGTSKITVTPIRHNHYEYHIGETTRNAADLFTSRLHAMQQGHIVTGNRPEFSPLFPDGSTQVGDPTINESELGRFPLHEVGDSKATVYDNVQYYHM